MTDVILYSDTIRVVSEDLVVKAHPRAVIRIFTAKPLLDTGVPVGDLATIYDEQGQATDETQIIADKIGQFQTWLPVGTYWVAFEICKKWSVARRVIAPDSRFEGLTAADVGGLSDALDALRDELRDGAPTEGDTLAKLHARLETLKVAVETVFDSSDEDLDQLSEIVARIQQITSSVDGLTIGSIAGLEEELGNKYQVPPLSDAALERHPEWLIDDEGYYSLMLKIGDNADLMYPVWWMHSVSGAEVEIYRAYNWDSLVHERPLNSASPHQAYLYFRMRAHDNSWGGNKPRSTVQEYAYSYNQTLGRFNTGGMEARPRKIDPAGDEMPYGWQPDAFATMFGVRGVYLRGDLHYRIRTKSKFVADRLKAFQTSGERLFAYLNAEFVAEPYPWAERQAIPEVNTGLPHTPNADISQLTGLIESVSAASVSRHAEAMAAANRIVSQNLLPDPWIFDVEDVGGVKVPRTPALLGTGRAVVTAEDPRWYGFQTRASHGWVKSGEDNGSIPFTTDAWEATPDTPLKSDLTGTMRQDGLLSGGGHPWAGTKTNGHITKVVVPKYEPGVNSDHCELRLIAGTERAVYARHFLFRCFLYVRTGAICLSDHAGYTNIFSATNFREASEFSQGASVRPFQFWEVAIADGRLSGDSIFRKSIGFDPQQDNEVWIGIPQLFAIDGSVPDDSISIGYGV